MKGGGRLSLRRGGDQHAAERQCRSAAPRTPHRLSTIRVGDAINARVSQQCYRPTESVDEVNSAQSARSPLLLLVPHFAPAVPMHSVLRNMTVVAVLGSCDT